MRPFFFDCYNFAARMKTKKKAERATSYGDPLGQAIADYWSGAARPGKLWIHNTYGRKEEMAVNTYFRDFEQMPALEHIALHHCRGQVADIGAGAGSHALWLQLNGYDVTAFEISPLASAVIRERGVLSVNEQNIFRYGGPPFDTLLLLMNGIGLCQSLDGLDLFLEKAKAWIRPGGQILFDSSDIAYLYKDALPDSRRYYGEIDYQYQYKRQRSEWFSWLYIDRNTLRQRALQQGWTMNVITEDSYGQYLVRLKQS